MIETTRIPNTTCAQCDTTLFVDPTQHQWFASVNGGRIFFCGHACQDKHQDTAEHEAAAMGLEHHFPHW